MRSLMIVAAALTLATQAAASANAMDLRAQSEQTGVQTSYQTASVDHTRPASGDDYNA